MNLTRLVRRNVMRHPIRAILTAGGAMFAVFLLIFLRSIVTSLDDTVKDIGSKRVITASAVSLFQALPESYGNKISSLDGVAIVSRFHWFGGVYEDPKNFFAQFAVDVDVFGDLYPECQLDEGEWQAWRDDRKGCVIGSSLAERFGWKVGDKVPLKGTIYPKLEGGAWEFNVCGIYETDSSIFDPQTLYFHYDYLKETMIEQNRDKDFPCGLFVIKMDGIRPSNELCTEIDGIYAGGPATHAHTARGSLPSGFCFHAWRRANLFELDRCGCCFCSGFGCHQHHAHQLKREDSGHRCDESPGLF